MDTDLAEMIDARNLRELNARLRRRSTSRGFVRIVIAGKVRVAP